MFIFFYFYFLSFLFLFYHFIYWFIYLHEFNLDHNASQTAANINRAWGEGSTCDQTDRRWFQKFRSLDTNFEDQEDIGRLSSIDDQHLKTLVEQNPRQSVSEMSQAMSVSISTISDHHNKKMCKVKKLDKWLPHVLKESQKTFEVYSMIFCRSQMIHFLIE